jgi:hypothetical protein
MAGLTRDEVVDVLGRADDFVIAEIIATGASREELAEACAWLANDEPLMKTGRPRASGRMGRLVDILASRQEDDEALLESGGR